MSTTSKAITTRSLCTIAGVAVKTDYVAGLIMVPRYARYGVFTPRNLSPIGTLQSA